MSTYAIILSREPSQYVWNKIKEYWESSHYILSDRIAFIVSKDPTITTTKISDMIGMESSQKINGIVLQVSHFNGYEAVDLWEWFEKFQ